MRYLAIEVSSGMLAEEFSNDDGVPRPVYLVIDTTPEGGGYPPAIARCDNGAPASLIRDALNA